MRATAPRGGAAGGSPPVPPRTGGAAVLAAVVAVTFAAGGCGTGARVHASLQTCTSCHGAPPASPPEGKHPAVAADLTTCVTCHPGTVDASGNIVPGGLHRNGRVDGGHPAGYAAPAVHGRDFLGSLSGEASSCSACHGPAFDAPIAGGQSCNGCHAAAGWADWRTSCSFCHGVRDASTKAGYALADHPTWAAPPDAVSQRLTGVPAPEATGAHAAHLTASRYGRPVACAACHEVPTTVAHASGGRAAVALQAPWQLEPDPDAWSSTTRTCATACHGAGGSPAWTSQGLPCSGCHGVPPATRPHAQLGGDLGACSGCHPTTITPGGALILPGGTHLNGTVDSVQGHPDTPEPFYVASVHGAQYLNLLAGVPGAQDCAACHGAALASCTSCHATALTTYGGSKVNWVDWRTNCTFCHGTRRATYTAELLLSAAPGDTVSGRLGLTSGSSAARLGRHGAHLLAGTDFAPVRCAACHPVPGDLSHVSATRRATVVFTAADAFPDLTPAQRAALPDPVGVYTAATGRCSGYCHGATLQGGDPYLVRTSGTAPRWTSVAALQPTLSCTSCHGQPPATGKQLVDPVCEGECLLGGELPATCAALCEVSVHVWHAARPETATCEACHTAPGSAPPGTARYLGTRHVNGVTDVGGADGADVGWDATRRSCSAPGAGCHGGTARSWTQ